MYPVGVVDDDGPEAVDRYVFHGEPVDGVAVVAGGCDVQVDRFGIGIAAPAHRSPDEPTYRIDLAWLAEHVLHVGQGRTKDQQRLPHPRLTDRVPVGRLEPPG